MIIDTQLRLQHRIDNPKSLDEDDIKAKLAANYSVIVQFSSAISCTDKILSKIDGLCKKYDEHFGVRFYGFHWETFDCTVLLKIPSVKCLILDCITEALNTDTLGKLSNLVILGIGIYELEDPEILRFDSIKKVQSLSLENTKGNTLNLEYLKEWRNLQFLTLVGHTKNISAVGDIPSLTSLSLYGIKKISLEFINRLQNLERLGVYFGGRENLNELDSNSSIQELDIVRVRGFHDLTYLSRCRGLRKFTLKDQLQITSIDCKNLPQKLEYMEIENCKKLTHLDFVETLKKLKYVYIAKTGLDLVTLQKSLRVDSLKDCRFTK